MLIDPSFEGVNKLFVLSFQNRRIWESHEQNFLSTVEIKEYSVMIDGWIFFDQPIKNDLRTCDNIWKITISQGDDYTTGCLLDYSYFKEYYKLIAINLSKRQKLDGDSKAIQQINFTENLRWAGNTWTFLIIKEAKETVLGFSKWTVKVSWFYFVLMQYWYKMIKYNTLKVKLPSSQFNKLKSGIKFGFKVISNLSSNMIYDSNVEANNPNNVLITDTQV